MSSAGKVMQQHFTQGTYKTLTKHENQVGFSCFMSLYSTVLMSTLFLDLCSLSSSGWHGSHFIVTCFIRSPNTELCILAATLLPEMELSQPPQPPPVLALSCA